MKTTLIFETIVQDCINFEGGKVIPKGSKFPLFLPTDTGVIENDVRNLTEEEIIKFFMASNASKFLFENLEMPFDSFFDFSVIDPIRHNPKHPDFDLVVCDFERPELTTAIQCKRVKVLAESEGEDRVNKLEDIGSVVKQSRIQRDYYGFHQNYIMIIIETSGRNRTNQNSFFRGPTEKTFKEIYEFPYRESVHEDVGIIIVKITQPTGRSYEKQVSIGVCFDKLAKRLDQSAELTNRIKELISLKT
jgi:hypothetical protein